MTRRVFTTACMVCALACGACAPPGAKAPGEPLRIATGSADGIYYALGTELARAYARRITGISPTAFATAASGYNVQAIESDQVDLAFALGDVAYLAYTRGTVDLPRPHRGVRAIAVLYVNVFHILTRPDGAVSSVADLRGRRVAVGRSVAAGRSDRALNLDAVAKANGIGPNDMDFEWQTFSEVVTRLGDGRIAAGLLSSGYPVQAVTLAASTFGARLLPIDRATAERVRSRHPFFKLTTIPAGTYPGQPEEVHTLGVDNLLLCRDDMSDDLVYRLTREFFEALPEIGRTLVAARLVDVDRAATTPIPLHPGAARYYRERELLRW